MHVDLEIRQMCTSEIHRNGTPCRSQEAWEARNSSAHGGVKPLEIKGDIQTPQVMGSEFGGLYSQGY